MGRFSTHASILKALLSFVKKTHLRVNDESHKLGLSFAQAIAQAIQSGYSAQRLFCSQLSFPSWGIGAASSTAHS